MFVSIVWQWEILVVLRFGQFIELRKPGIRWLWPVVNSGSRKIDLRERLIQVPHQTCITKDNAPIDVDFLIYFRVMQDHPEKSMTEVQNVVGAAQGIATTTLRSVIGDIPLDDVLSKREQINSVLRVKLDEVTSRWGVKVTTVEIREIVPPKEVQAAMNSQMAAERGRRAIVTESEGKRTASVTVAEGEKQAAILRAEGEKQAAILKAEAGRLAQVLQAEGYADALAKIFAVAQTLDPKTMGLQYLETLRHIGNSPSTKYIFPMEFTGLMGSFRDMMSTAPPPDGAAQEPEHR